MSDESSSSPGRDNSDSPVSSPTQCTIPSRSKCDDQEMTDDENEDIDVHDGLADLKKLEDRNLREASLSPLNDCTQNRLTARKKMTKFKEKKSDRLIPEKSLPKEKHNSTRRKSDSKNVANSYKTCIVCFLISIALACYIWFGVIPSANSSPQLSTPELRRKNFVKDLQSIKKQFPNQNPRTWSDIGAGVMDMINGSIKPWMFVLFSDEPRAITCLADLIGEASGRALLSNDTLRLHPVDMGTMYGDTIDRLKPLIMEKKAVVVYDILNIDPGAIQAFHTMCDRENPLVNEAIYVITMIAPGYNPSQRAEVFVENVLTEKFVDRVPEDKLQPLITRLTDGPIIPVAPGEAPIRCSL